MYLNLDRILCHSQLYADHCDAYEMILRCLLLDRICDNNLKRFWNSKITKYPLHRELPGTPAISRSIARSFNAEEAGAGDDKLWKSWVLRKLGQL